MAATLAPTAPRAAAREPLTKVPTPNARTIAELSALLGVDAAQLRQDPAGRRQRRRRGRAGDPRRS